MDSTKAFQRAEELRIRQGLSAYRLCEKAGVSHNTYGAWKTRGTFPTVEVLEALADALGVSVVYFLTDVDDTKLSEEGLLLLSLWKDLSPERKAAVLLLLKQMK